MSDRSAPGIQIENLFGFKIHQKNIIIYLVISKTFYIFTEQLKTTDMKQFQSVNKEKFLTELCDVFIDSKIFGFECVGVSHDTSKNILILDMTGKTEDLSIKLDLSKIDIEIGEHVFNDEGEGTFTPKVKIK